MKHKMVNLWFQSLALKRCPNCKAETKGTVSGWYEYIRAKRRLVTKFCDNCINEQVTQIAIEYVKRENVTKAHVIGMGANCTLQADIDAAIARHVAPREA